jgi:hypothetical protein
VNERVTSDDNSLSTARARCAECARCAVGNGIFIVLSCVSGAFSSSVHTKSLTVCKDESRQTSLQLLAGLPKRIFRCAMLRCGRLEIGIVGDKLS